MNDEVLLREMTETNLSALLPGDLVIPHLFFDEAETFAQRMREHSFASYHFTTLFVVGLTAAGDIACFVKTKHLTPIFNVITVGRLAVNVREGAAFAKWMVVLRRCSL